MCGNCTWALTSSLREPPFPRSCAEIDQKWIRPICNTMLPQLALHAQVTRWKLKPREACRVRAERWLTGSPKFGCVCGAQVPLGERQRSEREQWRRCLHFVIS